MVEATEDLPSSRHKSPNHRRAAIGIWLVAMFVLAGLDISGALATPSGRGTTAVATPHRVATGAGATPIAVGMAADAGGGWYVTSSGAVRAFASAHGLGGLEGEHLRARVVGMASTPNGAGYWLVASDGGVFSFGDARFHGSLADQHLRARVVGMASTPNGAGYWLVASDGNVYSLATPSSTAPWWVSTCAPTSSAWSPPRMAPATGWWPRMVACSASATPGSTVPWRTSTCAPVSSHGLHPNGAGYWLASSDGGVSSFGDARPAGSLHDRAGTVTGYQPTGPGATGSSDFCTPTEFFEPSHPVKASVRPRGNQN